MRLRFWRRRKEPALSCREVVELTTEYLEGRLAELERLVDEHLDECDGCTEYIEQMRATIGLLREVGESGASDEEVAAVLASLDR